MERISTVFHGQRTTRLLLLLSFVGFSISISSSIGVQIDWIPLDRQFGLLEVLPWTFYLGLATCILSIVLGVRSDSERVFILKALLLFLLIWGIPVYFEGNASVWDTYDHLSTTMEVTRTGFIPRYDVNIYSTNWPGAFIFIAASRAVTDIDPMTYAKFYPLFAAGLTLIVSHLFLKRFLPRTRGRTALLAMIFLTVWFQFHVSPQSVGLLLGILTLVCVGRRGSQHKILAILLFAALIICHATTMFVVVAALSLQHLIQRIRGKADRDKGKNPSNLAVIFVVMAFSWLFFNAFGTSTTLVRSLQSQLTQILFLDERVGDIFAVRTTENIYPIPPNIRMAAIGVFVLLSIAYLLLLILVRILRRSKLEIIGRDRSLTLPISLFVVSFFLAAGDILVFGGQFYDRNILFIAIVSPILAIALLSSLRLGAKNENDRSRRVNPALSRLSAVFIVCMLGVAFASFTTVFYQENFYVVSDASFDARGFLVGAATNESKVEGGRFPSDLETFAEGIGGGSHPLVFTSSIVVLDIHTEIWRTQWLGKEGYESLKTQSTIMSRFYVNGEYEMFWDSPEQ